jgi:hypothetical protein
MKAQGTYLELHTWYPYENSDRCNPAEGTVPVKVFTVRNFSDSGRSKISERYFVKNFHVCPIRVYVNLAKPFVNPPKRGWYNDSVYKNVYEDGRGIELLRIIGNALNMSLDVKVGNQEKYLDARPYIEVGGYATLPSLKFQLQEYTRSYLTVRFAW